MMAKRNFVDTPTARRIKSDYRTRVVCAIILIVICAFLWAVGEIGGVYDASSSPRIGHGLAATEAPDTRVAFAASCGAGQEPVASSPFAYLYQPALLIVAAMAVVYWAQAD